MVDGNEVEFDMSGPTREEIEGMSGGEIGREIMIVEYEEEVVMKDGR